MRKFAYKSPKFAAIDKAIGRNSLKFVTLLRLSPLLPLSASNYIYGLTRCAGGKGRILVVGCVGGGGQGRACVLQTGGVGSGGAVDSVMSLMARGAHGRCLDLGHAMGGRGTSLTRAAGTCLQGCMACLLQAWSPCAPCCRSAGCDSTALYPYSPAHAAACPPGHSVELGPYVLGSWLGMLPGTYAYVSAGVAGRAMVMEGSEGLSLDPMQVRRMRRACAVAHTGCLRAAHADGLAAHGCCAEALTCVWPWGGGGKTDTDARFTCLAMQRRPTH